MLRSVGWPLRFFMNSVSVCCMSVSRRVLELFDSFFGKYLNRVLDLCRFQALRSVLVVKMN